MKRPGRIKKLQEWPGQGEKERAAGRGRRRLPGGILAAVLVLFVFAAAALPQAALAATETRTAIESISLYISSTIVSGVTGGSVYVTTSDSEYYVGSVEIMNDNDEWKGGMTPRVQVDLHAYSGYYFSSTGKSVFTLSGDEATYVSASRSDEKSTLTLTFKLATLDNGDLTVTNPRWSGTSGVGVWDENTSAKTYQVKLYRDDTAILSTSGITDNEYDFSEKFTKKGDYYFTVRAVGSSEKGDWASSEVWTVTASEAENISWSTNSSLTSHSYGPGGTDSWGFSLGPGVSTDTGTSSGPGVTTSSSSSGSGDGPGGTAGVSTGTDGYWCLDTGWWFQYTGGGKPTNCWLQIDGTWYCFGEDGYLRCGWILWNGSWYYTDESGALLVNTKTPDGYYVGGNGAWIQ